MNQNETKFRFQISLCSMIAASLMTGTMLWLSCSGTNSENNTEYGFPFTFLIEGPAFIATNTGEFTQTGHAKNTLRFEPHCRSWNIWDGLVPNVAIIVLVAFFTVYAIESLLFQRKARRNLAVDTEANRHSAERPM